MDDRFGSRSASHSFFLLKVEDIDARFLEK
jgi:hypothetical protein